MITLKPITPKGFRAQMQALPAAVDRGLKAAAEAAKRDFMATARTWEREVTFTVSQVADGYAVGTDDEVWRMVDEGTRAHVIVARGKVLRFATGGTPKTRPGVLVASRGKAGSAVVFRPRVLHPGTEPRRFTELLRKRWQRAAQPFIRQAIEEALR